MERNSPPYAERPRSSLDESGADVGGYLAAISRNRQLVVLTVLLVTATVLVLSLLLPKSYESVARISLDTDTGVLGTTDAESTQRRLATLQTLLSSREVLEDATAEVPGETTDSLEKKVDSSVDEKANIINITATDDDPERAASIAQAVANSFLDVQTTSERERLERAQQDLEAQVARLTSSSGPDAQVAAIQERLSQIAVELQLAGSELQIAQPAEVPDAPSSPRPLRNTVLALFGSLVIGILLALARDQLRPGLKSPREVSRLAGGLPVLATIPDVRRGLLSRRRTTVTAAAEHESYLTLRAAVRMSLPPERGAVILVTSALHGEGKTTVTARLGRGLAQAGHPTLLISADLRVPTLHELFGLPRSPGLFEEIKKLARLPRDSRWDLASAHRVVAPEYVGSSAYRLDVLTSGDEPDDPSRLLASKAAERFFKEVRGSKYDYVLIDSPPLLGIADVQALAPHADEVLMVGRLDKLTPESIIDAQDIFTRLGVRPMGLVVIGAKSGGTPYHYMQQDRGRTQKMGSRVD